MIQYECPHCHRILQIPDKYLGARGKCKRCGGFITVSPGSPFVSLSVGSSSVADYEKFQQNNEQLLEAAKNGQLSEVRRLLAEGANANYRDRYGVGPLQAAAGRGGLEMVKALLLAGADAKSLALDGCTPLHVAAGRGHFEVAKLLIEGNADVCAVDKDGETPLHVAARSKAPKDRVLANVALLLAKGAYVNARDKHGQTPLHEAAEFGHPDVLEFLEEHGGRT